MGDVACNAQQANDLTMLVAVWVFDGLKPGFLPIDNRKTLRNHGLVAQVDLAVVIRKIVLSAHQFGICLANQSTLRRIDDQMRGRVGKQIAALQVFDKHNVRGAAHHRIEQQGGALPQLRAFFGPLGQLGIELEDLFLMQYLLGDIARQREKLLFPFHHLYADGDFHGHDAAVLAAVMVHQHIVGARWRVLEHGIHRGIVKVHHDVAHLHLQKLILGVAEAGASASIHIQKTPFTVLQIESIGEMLQKLAIQGVEHRRPLAVSRPLRGFFANF